MSVELAHDERGPGRVDQAVGELAVVVFEDPKSRHLARETLRLVRLVVALDPEQNYESGADLAGNGTGDSHSGFGDSLTYRPHRELIISAPRSTLRAPAFFSYTRARPHPGWGLPPTTQLRSTLPADSARVFHASAPKPSQLPDGPGLGRSGSAGALGSSPSWSRSRMRDA